MEARSLVVFVPSSGFDEQALSGLMTGFANEVTVVAASTRALRCHGDRGGEIAVELGAAQALELARVGAWDAAAFIGGDDAGALARNSEAQATMREVASNGSVIAGIGDGVEALLASGLLDGVEACVPESLGELAADYGIDVVTRPVAAGVSRVSDGCVCVTARNFCPELVRALKSALGL